MKTPAKYFLSTTFLFLQISLLSQIVNIEERRVTGTNDSTYWYGSAQLGANVSKVKEQVLQLNYTAQVQYKRGKSLTLLLVNGNFLRAGDENFDEKAFAHLRYNYKIVDKLSTETFAQVQYNKLLLIESRTLVGTGLRYRLLKSKDGKQRVYGGLAYLYEHTRFLEGGGTENWNRLSSYISFTFRPGEGVKLINTTYYQPSFSDFGNYRFASESRVSSPLGKKLSLFTNFTFTIDESLPSDAPTSTYRWLNGLTYRF